MQHCLIELVSLQFVGGIGLDYALFFSRTQIDAEERARTLRTLFTCNVMALLTFSLLCLCRTPLLRQIGETVSVGILLALCFGFLFAGPRPSPEDLKDQAGGARTLDSLVRIGGRAGRQLPLRLVGHALDVEPVAGRVVQVLALAGDGADARCGGHEGAECRDERECWGSQTHGRSL